MSTEPPAPNPTQVASKQKTHWSWSNQTTLQFAELYMRHEVLWKKKYENHVLYWRERSSAHEAMSRELGISKGRLVNRCDTLMHKYNSQLKRDKGDRDLPAWFELMKSKLQHQQLSDRLDECTARAEQLKCVIVDHLSETRCVTGARLFTDLHTTLHTGSCDDVQAIWTRMRFVSLQKLSILIAAGDEDAAGRGRGAEGGPGGGLLDLEWRIVDLVMLYDNQHTILTQESPRLYAQLRALVALFHLVQEYHLEDNNRSTPQKHLSWLKIHHNYIKSGRAMSLVCLQRRWCELKRAVVLSFTAYWHATKAAERKFDEVSAKDRPPFLYVAIARRYPEVVLQPQSEWREMVDGGDVITSPQHYQQLHGALPDLEEEEGGEGFTVDGEEPRYPYQEEDDDIILVEKEIETIDLDLEEGIRVRSEKQEQLKSNIQDVIDVDEEDDKKTTVIIDSDCEEEVLRPKTDSDDVKKDAKEIAIRRELIEIEIKDLSLALQNEMLQTSQFVQIKEEKHPESISNDNELSVIRSKETVMNNETETINIDKVKKDLDDVEENLDEVKEYYDEAEIDLHDDATDIVDVKREAVEMTIEDTIIVSEKPSSNTHSHTQSALSNTTPEEWSSSDESSVEDEDIKPCIDLKLVMIPVVPLTKVDLTSCWKKYSFKDRIYLNQVDFKQLIPKKRKLIAKHSIDISDEEVLVIKKEKRDIIEEHPTILNVSTHPLEVPRLIKVISTKNRQYTPVSLCKNPDFNTRLKRLSVVFLLTDRNKKLMNMCKPLTVDVDKLSIDEDADNDESDIVSVVECEISKPRVVKKIELPDIDDVRRINRGLLTAEVTPLGKDIESNLMQPPGALVRATVGNIIDCTVVSEVGNTADNASPTTGGSEVASTVSGTKTEPQDEDEIYNQTFDYLKKTRGLIVRQGLVSSIRHGWTLSPRLQWTRTGDVIITHSSTRSAYPQYPHQPSKDKSDMYGPRARRGRGGGRGALVPWGRPAPSPLGGTAGSWWRPPLRALPPPSPITTDTYHLILKKLRKPVHRLQYCCLARRHRAVNDARRRLAAKLMRYYTGDKQIHCHEPPLKCNCCCKHLLETSSEQIEAEVLALDQQIQAILDSNTVPEETHSSGGQIHNLPDKESSQPQTSTSTEDLPPLTSTSPPEDLDDPFPCLSSSPPLVIDLPRCPSASPPLVIDLPPYPPPSPAVLPDPPICTEQLEKLRKKVRAKDLKRQRNAARKKFMKKIEKQLKTASNETKNSVSKLELLEKPAKPKKKRGRKPKLTPIAPEDKPTEDTSTKLTDAEAYDAWIRERNLASQLFGIKPRRINNTKSVNSTFIHRHIQALPEGNQNTTIPNTEVDNINYQPKSTVENNLNATTRNTEVNNTNTDNKPKSTVEDKVKESTLTEKNLAAFDRANDVVLEISDSDEDLLIGDRTSGDPMLYELDPVISSVVSLACPNVIQSDEDADTNQPIIVSENSSSNDVSTKVSIHPENTYTIPIEPLPSLVNADPVDVNGATSKKPALSERVRVFSARYASLFRAARDLQVAKFLHGRDPTTIKLLLADTSTPPFCLRGGVLVVTERECPVTTPQYWTLGPPHRVLCLPHTTQERQGHTTDTTPTLTGFSVSGGGVGGAPGEGGGAAAAGARQTYVSAPRTISIDNKHYLKLSDIPLIYAQVLTIISKISTVRNLLQTTPKSVMLYSIHTQTFSPLFVQCISNKPLRVAVHCDSQCCKEATTQLVVALNMEVSDQIMLRDRPRKKKSKRTLSPSSSAAPVLRKSPRIAGVYPDYTLVLDSDDEDNPPPQQQQQPENNDTAANSNTIYLNTSPRAIFNDISSVATTNSSMFSISDNIISVVSTSSIDSANAPRSLLRVDCLNQNNIPEVSQVAVRQEVTRHDDAPQLDDVPSDVVDDAPVLDAAGDDDDSDAILGL